LGRFMDRHRGQFPHTLPLVGSVVYRVGQDEPYTIGVLHEYAPNTVSAWQFAQDSLGRFFEQVMAQPLESRPTAATSTHASLWELAEGDAPAVAKDLLGGSLEWATLLGRRTGEMHGALAADRANPDFAPEPFSQFHQRSIYQSSRKLTLQTFQRLRSCAKSLPALDQALAREVLDREKLVLEKFRSVVGPKIIAKRIRCHGDYHLGHVLYTGKDFLIVDFEGELSLPLSARRIKRSPLDDVAGMVHSFHDAASQAVLQLPRLGVVSADAIAAWRQTANFWSLWCGSAFLRAYATTQAAADLLPESRAQWDLLLHFHLLEETMYELRDTMTRSPEQISVPLQGILELTAG